MPLQKRNLARLAIDAAKGALPDVKRAASAVLENATGIKIATDGEKAAAAVASLSVASPAQATALYTQLAATGVPVSSLIQRVYGESHSTNPFAKQLYEATMDVERGLITAADKGTDPSAALSANTTADLVAHLALLRQVRALGLCRGDQLLQLHDVLTEFMNMKREQLVNCLAVEHVAQPR